MSEEKEPVYITASYTGKVGNIPGDKYGHESPGIYIKEQFEGTDEERHVRQWGLILECYDMYQAFKEEALRPLVVNGTEPDPKCSVPQMEAIRQEAITLIEEQGKWFQDKGFQVEFRVLYNEIFKKDFDGDLQKLSFSGSRTLNRKLGALQHKLNGKNEVKTKEKA